MMSCFLIRPYLFSRTPQFALLCPSVISPLVVVSTVFSFVFVPFCVFYSSRAAELSGNPVESLSFWLLFYCLSCGLFFDSMFARISNWTFYPVTHFSWQTSSPKVYLWAICCEGQRHKSSTRFLNNQLPHKSENKCIPCRYYTPLNPKLNPL